MPALSAAVCVAQQLTARLNEWEFDKCTWSSEDTVLWCDDGGPLEIGNQKAVEWSRPSGGEGDEPMGKAAEDENGQTVPPERCLLMFLFLNSPGWNPEWGGALRCHVGEIYRDVWGDGGRMVLLRESSRYELQPSFHHHIVLMMRLQGARVSDQKPPSMSSKPKNVQEIVLQSERMKEVVHVPPLATPRPELYHRKLTKAEVQALASQVGVRSLAEGGDSDDSEDSSEGESDLDGDDSSRLAPSLDLDSHQVLNLFELTASFAFRVD